MKFYLRTAALCSLLALAAPAIAEDADRFRPYIRFHSGDIEPRWGVDDHWAFGVGANLNRYFGVELALDAFEREYERSGIGTIGEVGVGSLMPEVRLRYPLLKDKLVPYLLAGVGPSFQQINDLKGDAEGHDIDIEGYTWGAAVGGGIEYFIADNVTFGIEARYLWFDPLQGKIDGDSVDVDVSCASFTFGLRIYFDENNPRPLVALDERKPNRFYFGVRVGGAGFLDDEIEANLDLDPEPAAWFDTINQTGGFVLGADFGPALGLEISIDSLEARLSTTEMLGEYGMGIIVPQLRLRFPTGNPRLSPYLMAGVGVAYGEFNDSRSEIDVDAKGIYPTARVGAGLEYFLVRNFSFNADAGWIYSWGHEFDVDGRKLEGDFSALQVTLGFRVYLFEF
jgi:opacity protein-like surface antigen